MEVIAEAQVFAEVTGIGCTQMEEFIGNMFGPVLESYSHRYVHSRNRFLWTCTDKE